MVQIAPQKFYCQKFAAQIFFVQFNSMAECLHQCWASVEYMDGENTTSIDRLTFDQTP